MNGETTFRDKMGARDSAHICTFSTTRFGWVSCLVNLYFVETPEDRFSSSGTTRIVVDAIGPNGVPVAVPLWPCDAGRMPLATPTSACNYGYT